MDLKDKISKKNLKLIKEEQEKVDKNFEKVIKKQKKVLDKQTSVNSLSDGLIPSVLNHFNLFLESYKFPDGLLLKKSEEAYYYPENNHGLSGYEIVMNIPEKLCHEDREYLNQFRQHYVSKSPHARDIIFRKKRS
jgi:hypothetical protein